MERYAVVLIKPDAIRDVLEERILRDLQEEALVTPVFRKFWKVTADIAELLYPEWIERLVFPAMLYNITQGESLFVVVRGDDTMYQSLARVKGKMNQGGLRLKYRAHSIEEWRELGYSGRDLENKIAENRLHTTDTFEEAVFLCKLAFTSDDLAVIRSVAPRLAQAVRRKAMQL
ncbi:MAG: nucleoside-diphosphate kinase [Candidatus Uhrbacteria bacterium]|nr:nucleoside-diphosphate kinase [Candidatus Uhrbacteria bacterium]